MSSILVLKQHSAVHLMADATAYDRATGILSCNNLAKCVALPTLQAAISCTGPAGMGAFLGYAIAHAFSSFDDLIARAEDCLPGFFKKYADVVVSGDALSTAYLIGWHEAEARPAAYAMDLWTDDSSRLAQVLENDPDGAKAQRFKLSEQSFAGTPLPGADLIAAAGFKMRDEDDLDPEIDLLHLIEIQRHEEIEGHYWVGGKALLTSIDRDGISQRVVHHWKEDQVGQPIMPRPIEWKAWREARQRINVVSIVPDGLSLLQRRRMEKKARKGTLRTAPGI